jgi:hypothetical protein
VLNSLGQSLLQTEDRRQAQAAFNQAHGLIETLAGQLEEAELRASCLNSVMVQEIRTGLSHVAETRLL